MVVWDSTIHSRLHAVEPVTIDCLCSRLNLLVIHGIGIDVYISSDQVDCKCRDVGVNALCFRNFFDLGGVLISSSLSKLWHSRRDFLLYPSFWRLWDVIAFSGWVTISTTSFQSAYNLNECQCEFLIPLLPMLDPSIVCDLRGDELFTFSVGYSLFRDLLNLFKYFISIDRWGFGSASNRLTDGVNARYVAYHIKLLDLMITRLSPPCDILSVMLDLNLWGVCKSSTIYYLGPRVAHDSFESTQINAMMLVLRTSCFYSVSAHCCINIMHHCEF